MEVNIAQPLGFSQLGSRTNNEDTLFPDPQTASLDQKWFMVCDGVGGAERGEIASKLAATEFDHYFRNNPVTAVSEAYIQQALEYVQDRFDDYVAANPQAESMGTTLTLVYRHEEGITVAHIGDSRVYLVRQGVIEWRTDDHSYVNELVKAGALKPEEARKHPQRNVITRAIQSGPKRSKADVQLLNDLQAGDYLFMCTDGILERISDELLEKTLGTDESNEEKLNTLLVCCSGHTRDNFTAYLLQIAHVSGSVTSSVQVKLPSYARPEQDDDDDAVTLIGVPLPETLPSYANHSDRNETPVRREPNQPSPAVQSSFSHRPATASAPAPRQSSAGSRWLPWALVVVFLGVGCFFLWNRFSGVLQGQTPSSGPPKNVTSSAVSDPTMAAAAIGSQLNQSRKTKDSLDKAHQSAATATVSSNSAVESDVLTNLTLKVVSSNPDLKLEVTKDDHGKQGLRHINGEEIFEPQFERINLKRFKWGLIPVLLNGSEKYITSKGQLYDKMGNTSQKCNMLSVRKDKVWGYVNSDGEEIIKPQYKQAKTFERDDKGNCSADVTDQAGNLTRITLPTK